MGIHSFTLSHFTLLLKMALLKERPCMSDSLSSLCKKEGPWANRSHRSFQKREESESLLNKEWCEWFSFFWEWITLKKTSKFLSFNERFAWKFVAFAIFWQFFNAFRHFKLKSESLRNSSLHCSFLKSDGRFLRSYST